MSNINAFSFNLNITEDEKKKIFQDNQTNKFSPIITDKEHAYLSKFYDETKNKLIKMNAINKSKWADHLHHDQILRDLNRSGISDSNFPGFKNLVNFNVKLYNILIIFSYGTEHFLGNKLKTNADNYIQGYNFLGVISLIITNFNDRLSFSIFSKCLIKYNFIDTVFNLENINKVWFPILRFMVYHYPNFFKPLYNNNIFDYQENGILMLGFVNKNMQLLIPFINLIKYSRDDWEIIKDQYNKYLPIYKSKFPYIMFCTYLYSVFKNINIQNKYNEDTIENYLTGFQYYGFMDEDKAKNIKEKKSVRDIMKKHNLWFGSPSKSTFKKIENIFTDEFLSNSFDLYEKNKDKGFSKLVMPDLYSDIN